MSIIITKAMLSQAARSNSRLPDDERWSRLVTQAGRLAKRVTRKGITASELRDERPKRAVTFGSELPRCRRHGAKGSTKTLPGKLRFGRGQVNTSIILRNSMIAAGLIPVRVVKRGGQTGASIAEHTAMQAKADAAQFVREATSNINFDMLKRMLTPAS